MVTAALLRIRAALAAHNGTELQADLAAGSELSVIESRLRDVGIEATPELIEWFSFHDGGWAPGPIHWQLLSLDASLENRVELLQQLGGASEAQAWVPFKIDSLETFVVDTTTGRVLKHDIVSGLAEIAPSLGAWIDSETRRLFGEVDDLEHEEPTRQAVELPEPAPAGSGPGINEAARAPLSKRLLSRPVQRAWRARAAEIAAADPLPDGRLLVAAVGRGGTSILLVDAPNRTERLLQAGLAPLEQSRRRAHFAISPTGRWAAIGNAVIDTRDEQVLTVGDTWPLPPDSKPSFLHDDAALLLTPPDGAPRVVGFGGELGRELRPGAVPVGRHALSFDGTGAVILEPLGTGATHRIEPAALGVVELGVRGRVFYEKVSADGSYATIRATPNATHGIVGIELATGTARLLAAAPGWNTLGVVADGSAVLAAEFGYPTVINHRIPTDGSDPVAFGRPQPEPANRASVSDDGRWFAHHAMTDDHRLAIELIDLADGTASLIELEGSVDDIDILGTVDHGPGHIVFWDRSTDNLNSRFAAPIINGRLGESVRLNADSEPWPQTMRFSADGRHAVWFAENTVQWCTLDGGTINHVDSAVDRDDWRLAGNHLVLVGAQRLQFIEL